jgi:hypothetical protein
LISLWLPTGILGGWLVADCAALLVRGLERLTRCIPWKRVVSTGLAGATLILGILGSWHLVDVINPVTLLVTPEDLGAIRWAQENTPPEARFLINTGRWSGEMRMGTDAGWWLQLLARRQVTLPCLLYHLGSREYREAVNDLARTVEEAKSLGDPNLHRRLVREGITHVFVGARGGRLMPKELDASPYYRLRYSSGPVRIYELLP